MINIMEGQDDESKLGDLSPEEKKKLAAGRLSLDVAALVKAPPRGAEAQVDAGKRYYDLQKAGTVVQYPDTLVFPFWSLTCVYAETQRDAETYDRGFGVLKAKFGDNAAYKARLQYMAKTLEKLKSGK